MALSNGLANHLFDDCDIELEGMGFTVSGSLPEGTVEELQNLREFPEYTSEEDTLREREKADALAMTAFYVADMVRSRGKQRSAILQIQNSLTNDKISVMRSAQATAKTEHRLGGEVIKHNYLMQAEERGLQGMSAAMARTATYV